MTEDLLVYYHRATNRLTVTATNSSNGTPVAAATVKVTLLKPDGTALSVAATDIPLTEGEAGVYSVVLDETLVTQDKGRVYLQLSIDGGEGLRALDRRYEAQVV